LNRKPIAWRRRYAPDIAGRFQFHDYLERSIVSQELLDLLYSRPTRLAEAAIKAFRFQQYYIAEKDIILGAISATVAANSQG